MDLTENKYLNKKTARLLDLYGWDMESLATAAIEDLTEYRGVGRVTAQNIISEARQLVNENKLHEAVTLDAPEASPAEDEPAVSVRVKRIREMNRE